MSNPQTKKKAGLNSVISWGASVVIIGLMFKILHWPFGEYIIGIGLATESLLFAILGFASMNVVTEGATGPDGKPAESMAELLSSAITPKVIEKLTLGFQQFTKTVESVNQVTASFGVTQSLIKELENTTNDVKKFRDNMSNVAGGFDQFNKAMQSVGQLANASQVMVKDMSSASQAMIKDITASSASITKDFEGASQGMKQFSKNVVEMNASFDQFSRTLAAINQMTASSASMLKEFEATTNSLKAYNKNLSDITKIYQAQLDAFKKA